MKPSTYKLFAKLCEAYIQEASTSLDIVKKQPGGAQVIKHLHTTGGLAHDQDYRPVDKISWSELKDSWKGAWVIIVGSKGTGAIRAAGGSTGDYEAVAVDQATGELRTLRNGRGGNILDFLKPLLGKFNSYYVGKNSSAVKDKQRQRQSNQAGTGTASIDQEAIVKKFRPLWVKATQAAIADVKGMAATMIKNDAYEKAEKKINLLRKLENAIEAIDGGSNDVPDIIRSAVSSGLYMAAAHYYPEQTGEISRARYGGSVSADNYEGPQQILKDISSGDAAKLGTILGFFKRSLMTL